MVFETLGTFLSKLVLFHGYVNEYNGFPKPLTKDEEDKLVEQANFGDEKAREKLINHNMRLVAHVCKKYNGAAEADDLLSVGSLGLIKGIDSYQKDKGSQLSTYVSRCIENEILMLLRANKKHKICVSIEEPIGVDKDGQEMSLYDILPQKEEQDPDFIVERKVFVEEIKSIMKKKLNEREFKIVCLRYGLIDGIERTQQEVANILQISRSYISRIETKAIELIREEFSTHS
ncbi:MAG: RNA polymerase sporulation sigma factor SigK [Clostridia bacterium]|nr:RNA polymerase sporulation sigma factor SigK [Clostridia bacterium]